MNTSINQAANVVANLQRREIPSKNPEEIPNINQEIQDQSLQNKIGSIDKRHCTRSVVWEMQPCRYDEKLNIIK